MIKKKYIIIGSIFFLLFIGGIMLLNISKTNILKENSLKLNSIIKSSSFNEEDMRNIGYEFLNSTGHVVLASQGETVHIWNTQDDYFFNKSSGIQFTNHFQDYWTKNIFCIGYYNNSVWNKIYCADELENFNRTIATDNSTYVNATLWKDVSYGAYDLRLGVQYNLGLNDKNLSITIYGKNLGIDIPFDLGFAWKITEWEIPPNVGGDSIKINSTRYNLDGTYDLLFDNMLQILFEDEPEEEIEYTPYFRGQDYKEFLRLDWNKDLDYKVKMYGDGNQNNFYVAVLINAGHFNPNQKKSTTLYWIDAEGDLITNWDTNAAGATSPPSGMTNNTLIWIVDRASDDLEIFFMNGTHTGRPQIDFNAAAANVRGAAMDDTFFYAVDDDDAEVYIMFHNGTQQGSWDTAVTGNTLPRGMEYSNDFLYINNLTGTSIFKYFVNGTPQGTVTVDDGNPGENWGVATFNETFMWTTDFGLDRFIKNFWNGTATGTSYVNAVGNHLDLFTNGTFIWIVEAGMDEVYVYEGSGFRPREEGDFLSSFDTSAQASTPRGIDMNETFFWIVAGLGDTWYKYFKNGTYAGESFDFGAVTLNDAPYGIATDGNNLWIGDNSDDEIYKYFMNGTPIDSFDTSGQTCEPIGIDYFQDNLYVVCVSDIWYEYFLNGTFTGTSFDFGAVTLNDNPVGISTNGNFTWIGDTSDDSFYKYFFNGTFTGKVFSLTTPNGNPSSLTENSTHLWVTDSLDSEVYIYFLGEPVLVDSINPTWSDNQTNGTVVSTEVTFAVLYNDDTALQPNGGYIFSTNNTGAWINETLVLWTSTPQWANVTKVLPANVGNLTQYRWFANDSAGNANNTDVFSVTTTSADTCTYTSGNWDVDCSDFCNITSNVDVGGNDINIIGTGTFVTTANISNYGKVHIEGTDSSNICRVTCLNGGCFKE